MNNGYYINYKDIIKNSTICHFLVFGKDIYVSLGQKLYENESKHCGRFKSPCSSIDDALSVYKSNDVINIDGGNDKSNAYVYYVKKPFINESLILRNSSQVAPVIADGLFLYENVNFIFSLENRLSIDGIKFKRSSRVWFRVHFYRNITIKNSIFLTQAVIASDNSFYTGSIDIKMSKLSFVTESSFYSYYKSTHLHIEGFIIKLTLTNSHLLSIGQTVLKDGSIKVTITNKVFLMIDCTIVNSPVHIEGNVVQITRSNFTWIERINALPWWPKEMSMWGRPFLLRITSVEHLSMTNSTIASQIWDANLIFIEITKLKQHIFTNLGTSCFPGSLMSTGHTAVHFTTSCQKCEKEFYSIIPVNWRLNIERRWKWERNLKQPISKCLSCPFGGQCNGHIKSKGGYWGYPLKQNKSIIQFISCPPKYCCPTSRECLTYDTCTQHRRGILCSECENGYSSSVTSNFLCISNKECYNNSVPFVIYVVVVAVFLFVMLYLKDIILNIKSLFKSNQIGMRQNDEDDCELLLRERFLHESFELGDNKQPQPFQVLFSMNIETTDYNTTSSVISGSVKILFFFYQVAVILRIDSVQKATISVPRPLDIFVSFFNIRLDLESSGLKLCVMPNMSTINVQVFKLGYLLIIFGLLFILSVLKSIHGSLTKYRQKGDDNDNEEAIFTKIDENVPIYCRLPFDVRLKCAFVQFLLIGFSAISIFCLHSINCVTINEEKHLHIQASIKCYQNWQYCIIAFIVLWMTPFCASVHLSSKLMTSCLLTPNEFLVCLSFPLASLLFFIRSKMNKYKVRKLHTKEAILAKHLLLVIVEPFKEPLLIQWEAILIFRRLMLVIVKIFIMSPIHKVFPLTVLLIIYMMHHNIVKPFKDQILNKVEFVSLNILISLGFANMFWAFTREYNLSNSSSYQLFGKLLMAYEVVILSLPFLLLISYILYVLLCKIRNRCSQNKED